MGYRFGRSLIVLLCFCISAPFLYLQFLSPGCSKSSKVCEPCRSSTKTPKLSPQHRYLLLIVIITGPNQARERSTMRQTWLSKINMNRSEIEYKFVMGTMGATRDQIDELRAENAENDDLILFENFAEGYTKLTEKMLHTLTWASESINFDYLFKADDDTFARLPLLVEALRGRGHRRRFYWGFFDGRAAVKKSGKWKESDWFLCDRYLPHALGGGYVLSFDLVDFIARNRDLLQVYSNEDVAVGTWLAGLDVERWHDRRFDTEYKSRGCHESFIVTHKQSIEDMKSKQRSLVDRGKLCDRGETLVRPSYEYDWKALPSQCCQRNMPLP